MCKNETYDEAILVFNGYEQKKPIKETYVGKTETYNEAIVIIQLTITQ